MIRFLLLSNMSSMTRKIVVGVRLNVVDLLPRSGD